MTFLEEAILTAKNVTSTVSDKTGKMIDMSRLRLSAAEIGKEISRRYEALGRVVYDAQKSGSDITGIISECVINIDALYNRLDTINAKIARIKDKKYCEQCGAVLDKSALYCSRCGGRVESKDKGSAFVKPDEDNECTVCDTSKDAVQKVAETVTDAADAVETKITEAAEDIIETAEKITE